MAEEVNDPIQVAIDGATAVRLLFNAYVQSGFSEAQALYLVGVILGSAIRANGTPADG